MERFNNFSATLQLDTINIGYGDVHHEILMNCCVKDVRKYGSNNGHVQDDELNDHEIKIISPKKIN